MTVMVAVSDSEEASCALNVGVQEALKSSTSLVVINLTLGDIDLSDMPEGIVSEVVSRQTRADRDPVDTALTALGHRPDVERLVIAVARRSPAGKFLLGSISQRLILEAEVPVLCVKQPIKRSTWPTPG